MRCASLTSGKECIRVVDGPATLEHTKSLLNSEPHCIELQANTEHAIQGCNISYRALLEKLKHYVTTPVSEEVVVRSATGMRSAHV